MPIRPTVLTDPLLNRGTAFTLDQRSALGLTGRLPAAVETLEQQAVRAYAQLGRYDSDLEKYIYLDSLHDRNEVLFYRLLVDHLSELLPVVYAPRSVRRSRNGARTTAVPAPCTCRST